MPLRRGERVLGSLAMVAAVGIAAGCGADDVGYRDEALAEEDVELETDVELDAELFVDPGPFLGDHVAVSGEVLEVIGPMAFRLAGPVPGQNVLVVSNQASDVTEDSVVKVTGLVDRFDILRTEEELGSDLDDEVFNPLEGDYAIVAKAVDQ